MKLKIREWRTTTNFINWKWRTLESKSLTKNKINKTKQNNKNKQKKYQQWKNNPWIGAKGWVC